MWKTLRYLALIGFWLPLALPGALLHAPIVIFARFAGVKLAPRKDVIATTKMLIGMALVVVSYGIAIGVLAWRAGPQCPSC